MSEPEGTVKAVKEKLRQALERLAEVELILAMEAEQNQDKACELIGDRISDIWIAVYEQLDKFNKECKK